MFQKPIESVLARFSSNFYPHYQNHDLEDMAVLSLKMEGGGVGTLTVGRITAPLSGPDIRMQVIGSAGVLSIENGNGRALNLIRNDKPVRIVHGASPSVLLVEDFVRSCLENKTPEVSLECARSCVRIQEAAWLSAKEGRVVRMDDL